MDGGFDNDASLLFSYNRSNIASIEDGVTVTAFYFRGAPSASSTLAGNMGERELVNRSIIKLQSITVAPAAAFAQDPALECIGIINPISDTNNTDLTDLNWEPVNKISITGAGNYFQPSFAEVSTDARIPLEGQIVFRFFISQNEPTVFDLKDVRELQNSVFGGDKTFPDGPDVLCVLLRNTSSSNNANAAASVILQWQEAQA